MGRGLLACLCVVVVLVPAAAAAPGPSCASVDRACGATPFAATFSASCEAASYSWDFGDGTSAQGQAVQHTYAQGSWTAALTAAQPDGSALVERLRVDAYGLSLSAPRSGGYRKPILFTGRLAPRPPALDRVAVRVYQGGRFVASAPVGPNGAFRLRPLLIAPGPYKSRLRGAVSPPLSVRVRPVLEASLAGSATVGEPLALFIRLHPRTAGAVRVRIWREGRLRTDATFERPARIRLDTRRTAVFRIRVAAVPRPGFLPASRHLTAAVVLPRLSIGSAGFSVRRLAARLAVLRYAVSTGSTFDSALLDGLYAFQKVQGLPRTGVADAAVWRALADPRISRPRYASPANHLEIDKPHQVLYVVRGGAVSLIVPVSTGAPGKFTPVWPAR